jgi:hypothetical protein
MEFEAKVMNALRPLQLESVRLDMEGERVSGVLISKTFRGMSSLDRQFRIDEYLDREESFTPEERRRIVFLAALTPEEYDNMGATIPIYGIDRIDDAVAVRFHGTPSDADYLRTVLGRDESLTFDAPEKRESRSGVSLEMFVRRRDGSVPPVDLVRDLLSRDQFVSLSPVSVN